MTSVSYIVERYGLEGLREHWMPGNYRRGSGPREKRPFDNESDGRCFLIEQGYGPEWSVYPCSICHKYHVASPRRA